MRVRRSALKDTVTVQTRTGGGSYGDTLSDPVDVPCFVDETRRMVRDAGGQQVVSEATLTLHPRTRVGDTVHNPMDLFSEGSEVLINGRSSEVLAAKETKLRSQVVAIEVVCA